MPSLAAKLADVMKSVKRIRKTGRNTFHNYDYVTEADLVEAIRGEMAKRNIILVPSVISREMRDMPPTQGKDGKPGKERFLTLLDVEFTFHDGDSDEKISFRIPGSGIDGEDKGVYKALTGAEKYALMKFFLVPTGDDPERDAHVPVHVKCEDCGRAITGVTKPGGEKLTEEQVLDNGRKKWDLDLCGGCQIKRHKSDKAKEPLNPAVEMVRDDDTGEWLVRGIVTEVFIGVNPPVLVKLGDVALQVWHKNTLVPLFKDSRGKLIDVVCKEAGANKQIEKVHSIGKQQFVDNKPVTELEASTAV